MEQSISVKIKWETVNHEPDELFTYAFEQATSEMTNGTTRGELRLEMENDDLEMVVSVGSWQIVTDLGMI